MKDKPTSSPVSETGRIQAEMIRSQYRQSKHILLALILSGSSVAVMLLAAHPIESYVVFTWLVSVYAVSVLRYQVVCQYFKKERQDHELEKWRQRYVFFAALSGITWGAAALLFFLPDDILLNSFLTVMLLLIVSTSMATTTAILPAFHVYAVITSTPLIYKFLSHSELNYNIFGVTILLFLTFLILFAKFNAKTLRESIALRFENLKLIEELKVQKKEAEQANTAKTKFLAAASHDLRQPLHAMGLLLGVLEQAPQATELQPVIQKIKRSCGAMSTLLETLLDISKLDAGIVKNSPSYFSLDNLFSSLKSEFEVLADEQGISLKIIPSSVTTYADYAHLERVIRNLVSNAIRYTPNGRVTLGAKRHHGSVLICVYDTGPGIPESKQKIVFNEFQQLENPERDRSKGLGLGLAIVKRLTGIMGTPLHVVSIEGKGSCFSVELPLCNQNEHMQEASLPQTSNNVLVGKRILIVDDEADILDAFESLLTSWGAQVLCATSGAEAEERVKGKDFQPHLIVSDYRLRNNETGSDVIRRIQKIVPQAVAIIVTGDTDPARLKEAEETGFYLLHKPVSTAKLRTLVTFSLMDT